MVIAFASAKGGAGKTVTASSLGVVLAAIGRTTLLVDCDGATNGLTLLLGDKVSEAKEHEPTASVRVRDAMSGEELVAGLGGHRSGVGAVTAGFLGDRDVVASAGSDGTVRLWGGPSYTLYASVSARRGPVNGIALSPHGWWLAAGFADGAVCIWDSVTNPAELTLRGTLEGHRGPVTDVAISPDDQWLASSGVDGTVRLWDMDGAVRCVLTGHRGPVNAVAIGSDGTWVASAGSDLSVCVWNVMDGALRHRLTAHEGPVTSLAAFQRSPWLASGGADGKVHLWSGGDGSHRLTINGHRGPVNAVAVRHDGTWVASAGSDGTVRVWNTSDGAPIRVLEGAEHIVSAVALSVIHGRDAVITGSGDEDAMLGTFDARTGAARPPRPLPVGPSLDLIPATYVMHQTGGVDPVAFEEALRVTLDLYRPRYDFIILDALPGWDGYALAAARSADRAVIVSEFDAVSVLGLERLQRLADSPFAPDSTRILFTKVPRELEAEVTRHARGSRYLPYLKYDIDVMLASAGRDLAVKPAEPRPYLLAIAQVARSLVPDPVRAQLDRWLEQTELVVRRRMAPELAGIEARLRQAELEMNRAEHALRWTAAGRLAAAGAFGFALCGAVSLAYLWAARVLPDPASARLALAAAVAMAAGVGVVAWRLWPRLLARRHRDGGSAARRLDLHCRLVALRAERERIAPHLPRSPELDA